MTDAELRDQVLTLLKTTTISYASWLQRVKNGYYTPRDGSATAWGKALTALAQIGVTIQQPPPPPPPPPSTPGNKVGVVRDGPSYDSKEDLSWASLILCDLNGLSAPKDHPNAQVYFYRSICTAHSAYDSAIPWVQANTNNWFLKDAASTLLANKGFGGNIIDFSNPACLDAIATNAIKYCHDYGFTGIWWDDVNAQFGIQVNAMPKGWTAASWRSNMIAATQYLAAKLTAVGLKSVVNATAYIGTDSSSDDGTLAAQYWQDIGSCVSFSQESWLQSPADSTVLMPQDTSLWYGNWSGWKKLQDLCHTMGVDFFPFTYGDPNGPELSYARATSLLSDSPCVLTCSTGKGVWCKDEGAPLGPAVQNGSVWTRKYTNGTVTVNTASPKPTGSL